MEPWIFTNKISLDAFGITSARQAESYGDHKLLQNQLLKRVCQFRIGIEALFCTVGDCVYVQHDVPNWGEIGDRNKKYGGGGRVESATNVTNAIVTVDRELSFQPGIGGSIVYEMMVRMEDDTIEVKEITAYNDATRAVTIDGVFTRHPKEGDVWIIGKQNLVDKLFTVLATEITSEQEVSISAIDYNELMYADDP